MSIAELTTRDIAARVEAGELSAAEVVEHFIEASRARADLNALTFLAEEEARASARELDERKKRGERLGRLAGVPVAVKDAICTRDLPTTAGSRVLQRRGDKGPTGWRPPYDSTAVARLRAEGAVILSKANMDEFAMGSSNETSAYGPVKNPWDTTRVPGGSSGGSAVAVAAGLAPVALGSDTGGSIRQPAALTGVVGVKPTFGRVSRFGLIAYASSLDQIGPMTRDVRSAARLLEVLAGADGQDSTVSPAPVGAYEAACEGSLTGLRIGLPEEYFGPGLEGASRAKIEALIGRLEAAGAELVRVRLPHTEYGIATYYLIATAEASTNLSRFDGVRFGLRQEESGQGLDALYSASRGAGFGSEVKRRILLGTYALSAGYYDAYYGKAQRVRTLIKQDFEKVFQEVDLLLTPTTPTPAFRLGEKSSDPLAMYLADVFTLPASLAGVPGIVVPAGTVEFEGATLPVGVQLLGPLLGEEVLFRAASQIEKLVSEA